MEPAVKSEAKTGYLYYREKSCNQWSRSGAKTPFSKIVFSFPGGLDSSKVQSQRQAATSE